MKKSKKILLTMGVVLPLLASTPLVAAGCVETKKPEVKPEGEKPGTTPEKKPEGEKPGTTPEVKPEGETTIENIINKHKEIKDDELNKTKSLLNELNKEIEKREIEKREEQNLLEKRNNLIKETEAKWDDITKKIDEYSKDATISKFPEFTQITDYLKYKNVELKNLKATKNNTIKLLVAKYFNILEAKILVENIIKNHNEIKDDELNKTKSLLNELNKEIEKREEQNLLEKRNNLIKETEAKWDDITKKIDEYSKDATISKFPEFTQITDYLKYKNVELKNLKATKNNTIKLLVAKYFNILEAKILVENIIKNHNEIKDDELNKTKSLLNELNKEIEKRTNQALSEAKKQLDSALKHAKKLNIGSLDFNQKFNFNKEFVRISGRLEKIKDNDLNAIKEITFELNSLINLTTSQKSKTTSEIKNDVEGEVHELNDLIAKLNDFVSNYVEETFNDIDEAGLISSIDNWIDMVEGFIKESKNPSELLYFKLEYLKSQTKTFYEQKMESWANKVSDLLIEKGYDLLDKIANIKMVKNLAGYQKELEDCLNEFAELDETITVEKQFELSKKLYDLIPKIQKELDNEHNKTLNNELN
ncbi:variable surface lipoprotein [Metamycoplasma hominis]|uniref:variable surface lipoprotein n=1 Tax=Metamycoplasma hominis TaxID=2098 RepID=UPI003CF4DD78